MYTMKKIAILLALFAGVSCRQKQIRGKYYHTSYNFSPQQQKNNTKNDSILFVYEAPNFEDDDRPFNRNPFKIPTLVGPSKAVGLLDDIEQNVSDQCFPEVECDPSAKFRTADGSCNNLRHAVWGQSQTAHSRIIQADYADGVSEPRKAKSGRDLPSSRRVRTVLFPDKDKPSSEHNLFTMQFGQVIAHDTELFASKTSDNGKVIECCKPDGSTLSKCPKECLEIKIPKNDPVPNKRCLSVPRAADTSDKGCQIKPVRQINLVSSFLDASLLYGANQDIADVLRSFNDGKLKYQLGRDGKPFLPNVKNSTKVCNVAKDNTVCYYSGDERVNVTPQMAISTISLLRLHNYLCEEFSRINPSWDDERLYQEAKRLLIGMYQHVTYNEFIPLLLGRDYARENKLLPLKKGYNNGYNVNLNPSTITSFTAAAFRAQHSYIQGFIELMSESRRVTSKLRLSDLFLRTDIVQKNDNYDSFFRGLITQHAHEQDQYITEEISEYLLRRPNQTDGQDLITLDLERGRDFGVPSYNKFRQLCGLSKAKTFNDITDQISKQNVDALARLYEHVDDIDYYAAGMLEKGKPGSILGHTFQCVVGDMFYKWKYGDRFFYEFGNQPGSFSLDQLNEIRKTSLALIVCLTSGMKSVQRNAFDVPGPQNPLVPCNSIPKLYLDAWSEVSNTN